MRLKIEQRHIDRGLRGQCHKCPIALALRDRTGHGNAGGNWNRAWAGGAYYDLSGPARAFVETFDFGGRNAVKPATFTLTPRETIR